MNRYHIENIDANITMFKNMVSALEEVKGGARFTATCAKYNISTPSFISLLNKSMYGFDKSELTAYGRYTGKKSIIASILSWQEKFYLDIVKEPVNINHIPLDLDKAFEIVFKEAKVSQETIECIKLRYDEDLTFEEIEKRTGRSAQVVRASVSNCLLKLQRPEFTRILLNGPEWWELFLKHRAVAHNRLTSKPIKEIKEQVDSALVHNDIKELVELRDKISNELSQYAESDLCDIYVADINIPVRLSNVLQRNGFQTISGLDGVNINDLLEIKGIGQKSVINLAMELGKYGGYLDDNDCIAFG